MAENNEAKFIKKILDPQDKIKPRVIKFDLPPDQNYQQNYIESLGFVPFVWYNGVTIDIDFITSLELYTSDDNIPALSLSFRDNVGFLDNQGIPMDNSIISVFISSRSTNLKSIHLDFKITSFVEYDGLFTVQGLVNIDDLYLKKFNSYSKLSSWQTYKKICEDSGLGYYSNIDDTDDKMTWINTGDRLINFMNSIILNSYKSDSTYLYGYIDFYNCFCYVDIEKELQRDIRKELGISGTGIEPLLQAQSQESTGPLYLSNDANFRESNIYFQKYEIINQSTQISLFKGYMTRLKYYDELQKSFLQFDVDSQMSDGETTFSLKSNASDIKFFNENINLSYVGKFDTDNVHKNFKYAPSQNNVNYDELNKIRLIVELVTPNFNLYKFRKIYVFLSNQNESITKSIGNPRLSGDWLITDIYYKFLDGKFRQKVELVRRDLPKTDQEIEASKSPSDNQQQAQNAAPAPVQNQSTGATLQNNNGQPLNTGGGF